MPRSNNLNALLYFEAVARLMRVNLAAKELNVSPSAVSQKIKLFEEQLGVSLYRRVRNRLVLTEAGDHLHSMTAHLLHSLQDSVDRIAIEKRTDTLSIRCSPSIGACWLASRIQDFADTHSEVDLHIDATPDLTDFGKESVDIEIRYGTRRQADIVSERLITDRVLPMASPGLARRSTQIGLAAMLAESRLIQTVKAEIAWETWLARHGHAAIPTRPGLRFDRSFMTLSAARNGFGIALESTVLAFEDLRSGALVPLAPDLGGYAFDGYWLNYPSRHLNRRLVKQFRDWIVAAAAAHERDVVRALAQAGCTAFESYDPVWPSRSDASGPSGETRPPSAS